ncbi:deoxyhypusine synthase-like [Leishmania donovani]|uniref:Deoxyhypusine synthase family protein n=1 Tax=Leishmania donovani TaxID=5661 RepID=A0A3Q8IEQ5_LEIDO|nr:deoxyhypusine synthase-like [Leishmania donovani]AYU78306.1 deoxyhypusine synthase, putative [Leishmania donovani]TPP49966.1 Deoxyhypusine synthase family protein [Leishmania donovani]CBZ33660.1 deoxyhypusine synthase-like [Leishmania donovani]
MLASVPAPRPAKKDSAASRRKSASKSTGAAIKDGASARVSASGAAESPKQSCAQVHGVDFQSLVHATQEETLRAVVSSLPTTGLQATQIGRARRLVQQILHHRSPEDRVFLAYTSNMISCGLRDTFTYLARERLVDCFISSAGGIEEDVIKCGGSTLIGQFGLDGRALRRRGINRIGNLLVPNDNYCWFEDFFTPVLGSVQEAQRASRWKTHTAPSEIIEAMGAAIEKNHPDTCTSSLVYWCYRNGISVFSPAFTDGSMGDMIYFYNFSHKGLVVDPLEDVVRLRKLAATGRGRNLAIVLGGGLPKHHLLRNVSMDAVVMVTTGLEADGCVSSGVLADDVACGLLREETETVRVQGDATVVFPLMLISEEAATRERAAA